MSISLTDKSWRGIEISVIVPCFNEEANLAELAARVLRVFDARGLDGELILVNDGSRDDTWGEIERLAAGDPRVRGVNHERNMGIEAGWRSGLEASKGRLVSIMDADLQNLPEDIWRLYREIRNNQVDLVQGYRSSIGRLKDGRYISSIGLNFILNFCFKMKARDNKSGFIMCRREVMADILRHRFRYRYFQTFITVAAKAKCYTIREVETLFEPRYLGKSFISKFSPKVYFWALWDVLKALVEYRIFVPPDEDLANFLKAHPPQREPEKAAWWRRAWFAFYAGLMPLHHWMISYNAFKYYRELKRSQYLTGENMRKYQLLRLQRIVSYAYIHCSYYKERMDAMGIKPEDIRTLDDIAKLPILDKADVRRDLYFDLIADGFDKKRMQKITTSGSTGDPLTLYADKNQLEFRFANTLRNVEWTGYQFGDRQLRLWHQTIGMTRMNIIKEKLDAWLCCRTFFPAFEIDEGMIRKYLDFIRTRKPKLLDGYAESFNLIARYLEQAGSDGAIRPGAIISSAQTLPQKSREIIEREFHTKVYDKYGAREFSGIAHQCCEQGGYHINAESYIVEVVKGGQPVKLGEIGEVLVTDLNNLCAPLIRYRLGDLAVLSDKECACGRGLPMIEGIEGRTQAIIIGTNGVFVPSSFFLHLIKDYDYAISAFQVVQSKIGAITLKIVKSLRFSPEVLERILGLLREKLGKDTEICVEYVESIPLGRTGKRQSSISFVDIDLSKGKLHEDST